MEMLIVILFIKTTFVLNNLAGCIWLPDYKIDLKQEEEFVISELLDRSDVQDIYDEEELIQEHHLEKFQIPKPRPDKYFRLRNMEIKKTLNTIGIPLNKKQKVYPEFNPDIEEAKPWIGGHVDADSNLIDNEDLTYFDDEAKSNKTASYLEKREADKNDDYNYDNLKAQYEDSVKKSEPKNDTASYKEVKENETPDEVVKNLVSVSGQNCSVTEQSGIGLGAIKCLLTNSNEKLPNKTAKLRLLKKVGLIAVIWILVYILIAVPLWCQYGWCCCCCRCKFCNPRNEIDEVKTFFANNPVGVYHENGILVKYTPTAYESYAQKNLEKAIDRL